MFHPYMILKITKTKIIKCQFVKLTFVKLVPANVPSLQDIKNDKNKNYQTSSQDEIKYDIAVLR